MNLYPARTARNNENAYRTSKCLCPGNPAYARKNDRAPLSNIQDVANRNQYLTANYNQNFPVPCRSKSVSFADKLMPIEPQVRPKLIHPRAESTRIGPSIKHPLAQLGSVASVRPVQRHDYQNSISTRPRAGSCRCPQNSTKVSEYEEVIYGAGNDEVFLQPSRSQITRKAESYTSEYYVSSIGHYKNKQSINPPAIVYTKAPANSRFRQSLESTGVRARTPNTLSVLQRRNCSSTSSLSRPENTSNGLITLPSQHFVTFTQDTLKTTLGSSLGKVTIVRDSSIYSEEDRSFVNGDKFFQDIEQGKGRITKKIPVCSPLTVNFPLRRSSSLNDSEYTRKPAVKTTLRRRSSIKNIPYPLHYSPEYKKDIIVYSYKYANNFLLEAKWIESYVDKRFRTFTVNWLLQVTEFVIPHFAPVYYMAVRLFDYSIINLRLRKVQYQLTAVVALWISMKYLDNTVLLKVPKIYSLCSGQYSKEQILSMERVILKSVNFSLNISDPLDFLHYYLYSQNMENRELLIHGCTFVLECATLFDNYSLAKSHFMVASVLYLAYKVIFKRNDISTRFLDVERNSVEQYAENVLALNVRCVIIENYEPVNKYLTTEKLEVAKKFFDV